MFGLGLPEIVIILLVLGVFFFGGNRVTEVAHSVGRASGEFKKGKQEIEAELRASEETTKT